MDFRNLTGRREIGANCYVLEGGDARLVLDCGMHPKEIGFDALPDFGPLPHDKAQGIVITHAHHDHIGGLPVLMRRQPQAPVYMTEITGELTSAMLHNSVNVMTSQRTEKGIAEYPLFTHRELEESRARFVYQDLNKPFAVPATPWELSFHDAGHILGSAGVTVREGNRRLFYTGDVHFEAQTICMAADFPKEGIDVLVMETTRGTLQRPAQYTRRGEKERLAGVIRETYEARGAVLIPVFALGKTQEVLLMLHELHEEGLIPQMPVHIGGLGTKISTIYDDYAERARRSYPGLRLLEDLPMLVKPQRAARRGAPRHIPLEPRHIYCLSSGMMTEGTLSNKFAWRLVENPRHTVAFVGYTDPDSPGYALRNASQGQKVKFAPDLPAVEVQARIESFDLSAHACREDLAAFAERLRPGKIILVHGDEAAQAYFQERWAQSLAGVSEVIIPQGHQPVKLW
jgi:Cft2 family RNA processing exonuclease